MPLDLTPASVTLPTTTSTWHLRTWLLSAHCSSRISLSVRYSLITEIIRLHDIESSHVILFVNDSFYLFRQLNTTYAQKNYITNVNDCVSCCIYLWSLFGLMHRCIMLRWTCIVILVVLGFGANDSRDE